MEPDKKPPRHRPQPKPDRADVRGCSSREDWLRVHPESIRIEPRWFHWLSPEENPKLEPGAPAYLALSSHSHPAPRAMPSIPRDPIRLIFIKHPLSTPHHGKKHCRKKWPHSGKTKRTAAGTKDEPRRGVSCLRRGGLERSPHPHVAGRDSPREEMAPRGAPGPASPDSASDRAGREKVRSRHCRTTARSSAPRSATPTPVPGRMASAGTEPPRGPDWAVTGSRFPALRPWPATLSQRDSHSVRGPSVSGPASPLCQTPAPPAAPRGTGQCREDRPGPSPHRPHPPDSGKAVTWRAGGGEDTTPRRKMRRRTVASGPGRFGKFGRLVPHWVTAVRCARAPGPSRPITPPLLTLPSRAGRQRRRRAHEASRLSLREGARVVT